MFHYSTGRALLHGRGRGMSFFINSEVLAIISIDLKTWSDVASAFTADEMSQIRPH
jgi:hypothetical protein